MREECARTAGRRLSGRDIPDLDGVKRLEDLGISRFMLGLVLSS
jgi:hypothetical protein